MQKTIEFEDHGQDFLQWTLNDEGKVVECQPFQGWIWCKGTVINHEELEVGGQVIWQKGRNSDPLTMNYRIASIEPHE